MCVAVKKKLQLYYWKDREFHELEVKYICDWLPCHLWVIWHILMFVFFLSLRGILQLQIFQSLWLGVKTPYVLVSNETIT